MEAWQKKRGFMRQVKYVCTLDPMEREVLGDLSAAVSEALIHRAQSAPKDELSELVGIPNGHKEPPEDPALARLLPDFEREGDEEYDGDNSLLRSLHENDICRQKIENLQVINIALGPEGGVNVTVTEEEVNAWIAGLNDIRLYVACGEITGDDKAVVDRENLVRWLAYCQESLLEVVMDS